MQQSAAGDKAGPYRGEALVEQNVKAAGVRSDACYSVEERWLRADVDE
jgi:hypothetical protein